MVRTGAAATTIGAGEFFDRARERLRFDIPPGLTDAGIVPLTGDDDNDAVLRTIALETPIRPAAVLIPVIAREQPTVLLTQRAAHLKEHAGQIAFPGGKIDATDASPIDAALREAWEEVGLTRDFVEPIGYLDLYGTSFGFRILPTLARVRPGFDLRINTNEVDHAFEVPLSFLMNPLNHKLGRKQFRGRTRSFYEMPFAERNIWGATAGILRVLYERVYLK
ncbi:NUDIX hydrolase [Nitrobacter winogradskyi Nb-255]|uniref:NUDIX hydrolase n=1 Tax=Nitrobacter winogradskyi (strain ATCC 25391 / DSM 10237 / CIP 104748 / NCIMB 11846 / Nb-255) TaxID=323098 RepID=Q3SPB4_NITWN|nr:CoA pyrophosphatase [Nitrobacter winogradskyi]ABA05877.1 NUDIX hydrolase [Nitrobacter winogradskyi Nb-255]